VHLVELSIMEQRYQAIMAVIQDGWKVTEVADRLSVTRQAVHKWIARYKAGGLPALADRSHRPNGCSHHLSPQLEAMICELRRQHPGWGPRRILHQLGRQGVDPLPGRSSIYRCLKRHNLIELRRRKKRRDEFRRWERDRPMQLWQMDVMSGVLLDDRTELKIVTGIDDHSRFCVAAGLVIRATSRAVCEVFNASMLRCLLISGTAPSLEKIPSAFWSGSLAASRSPRAMRQQPTRGVPGPPPTRSHSRPTGASCWRGLPRQAPRIYGSQL
jgi:transposase